MENINKNQEYTYLVDNDNVVRVRNTSFILVIRENNTSFHFNQRAQAQYGGVVDMHLIYIKINSCLFVSLKLLNFSAST